MKAKSLLVMRVPITLSALFLILCSGGVAKTHAQGYQAGFYLTAMSPSGEFNDNVTTNGVGGGGFFLKRIGPSPFLVGGDAGYVIYGLKDGLEPRGGDTTNNILLAHFLTRVQPRKGIVRPYAEGLIGLKKLYTLNEYTDYYTDYAVTENKTYLSDTCLSYGFGGGLQIPLGQNGERGFMVDGNVRYLRGRRARYLTEGSVREVDGVIVFDPLTSRTDVITIQIGISIRF